MGIKMLQHALFFASLLLFCLGEEQPFVKTSLGKIQGHFKRSFDGRTYAAFEGIPYAKPPVGNLRFEDPQSIEPWSGVWDATTTNECAQRSLMNTESVGIEDCLYLNVYVPKEKPIANENLDVVVFIHGGAFMIGAGTMGGPEFLIDRNIVYVNLNYRLGVLGFLSTEDEVVPGNMGLKDQVLALKWVQDHIRNFGGNPKSVTILGQSAGAASVHFHYFSPLSKGLFQRGISQSGTALAHWAIQDAPLKTARILGLTIGCDNPSAKELVKCLKERPVSQVIANSFHLFSYPRLPIAPFGPVVEKKSKHAFLAEDPYKMLQRGEVSKLPWLTTATTDEGLICFFMIEKIHLLNDEWDKMLPDLLDYANTVDDSDKPKLQQKIKEFYFGDDPVITNNIKNLVKLVGDRLFGLNIEKSARMQAKLSNSPVYSYIYGYQGERNFSSMLGIPSINGVSHAEDGQLLYQGISSGFSFKVDKLSESDERIKNLLVDMVVSFAKNGKPEVNGIEWDTVKEHGDFTYLSINNDGVKMDSVSELAPTEFWESLPIKENQNAAEVKDEL